MSRDIDTTDLGSLSKKDLEYLRDRGRLTPDQERQYLGGIYQNPPEGRSISDTPNTGDVDVNGTNPTKVSGEPDNGGSGGSDELPENYEDWKVAQLEDEIKERNADRDEDSKIVPASGRKDDLIAALAADDEAQGEE